MEAFMNLLSKEEKMIKNSQIPSEFYKKYNVKKGLRDINGKGVLAGLTNISAIHSFDKEGNQIPGILEYRAYNIKDIINDLRKENRFGFEEMTYLLLFGELPTANELQEFQNLLASRRTLPEFFVRETILTNPSSDVMNSMSRCILALASYDEKVSDISIENVLEQSFGLIADFPLLAIYSYQSYVHYFKKESLYIHYFETK